MNIARCVGATVGQRVNTHLLGMDATEQGRDSVSIAPTSRGSDDRPSGLPPGAWVTLGSVAVPPSAIRVPPLTCCSWLRTQSPWALVPTEQLGVDAAASGRVGPPTNGR
jgi:hypothetical protein